MRPELFTSTSHFAEIDGPRPAKPKNRHFRRSPVSTFWAGGASSAQQALSQNMAIRQNILANAIPVFQNVRSGSLTWQQGVPTTWTVLASNVGLIRRFWLEVTGTVNGSAAATFTPSMLGLSNLLSNIQFIDQNNRLRINTTGAHLHLAAGQKRRRPFGSSLYGNATPVQTDPAGAGANFPVQQSTGVVTAGTPKNFRMVYEIPVVNSNQDLTGAIYANQTTSNNQLQFTLNPNAFVFGADAFNACYLASSALGTSLPTLTNLTWTLYQDFLDQLPVDNTGFAQLPPIDIAYALVYQMINPGVQVAAQDNLYALPPFNVYQDLMLFWDNYQFNGAGGVGSDVNYIKVQISNTYILLQQDPYVNAIRTRNLMGSDLPGAVAATNTSGAVYDLDFRHKPLSVNQLSSTNIVFNPSTVQSATSNLQIGQEYIWYANQAAA
jgi:hypothetical protein